MDRLIINRSQDNAIKYNNLKSIEYLIGLVLNAYYERVTSGFADAAYHGNLFILKYMIGKGTDIHVDHDIALRDASINCHSQISDQNRRYVC